MHEEMSATTQRFPKKDKIEATKLLQSMGLTLNNYLSMSLKQLLIQRRIPFDIVAPQDTPNEETQAAMAMAYAKAYGLVPDTDPRFTDVDEFMSSLED